MGRHSTAIIPEAPKLPEEAEIITPPESPPSKKRKRDAEATAELEVDINAPEPPSKKALRKAKKAQNARPTSEHGGDKADKETSTTQKSDNGAPDPDTSKRSDHGIWIGNLSWMTTKDELRGFFEKHMTDDGVSITRLHLPPPSQTTLMNSRQKIKPVNKGFAYVDFATQEALSDALNLSETLFSGRKVLIKDAKNFDGRPEKPKDDEAGLLAGKPPSKRVFIGNLGYDTSREDLREHFSRCGEVDDVFLTTFEDSGKCKGYGWVTFAETEAAQAAVRGWVDLVSKSDEEVEEEDKDTEDSDTLQRTGDEAWSKRAALGKQEKPKKPKKSRKRWVNRFQGRPLRMEFAEGKDVRYKKRYGKGGTAASKNAADRDGEKTAIDLGEQATQGSVKKYGLKERRVDARTIKPGAALAAAPRLTGGIIQSEGKKTKLG